MTIAFPDISSYEDGLTIQPGTVAVIAKATEGTYYRDANYAEFKAQAAHVGAIFSAYHFLKAGGGAAQAEYCHAMVGSTPVMLDVETEGSSKPTVADCAAFIARMKQLGGRVWGAYFPQWYWQQVGGDLASLGVAIVSSNYTTYSDSGPGWAPYGGVTPMVWQYTDALPYGGQRVDFNAFKGSVAQLAALINGTIPTTTGDDDMQLTDKITLPPAAVAAFPDFGFNSETVDVGSLLAWTAARVSHIVNHLPAPVDLAALEAFIVQHQTAGASAADLAAALVEHLGIQVVAK
jgi:hypothetical protein